MGQLKVKDGFLLADFAVRHADRDQYESLELVVDTGALITIISPSVTDYLGFSAKDAFTRSTLDGAAGESRGYSIRVPRVRCLGFEIEDFVIACHDIDSKLGIVGLLGMNFLEHFRIDMDFKTGQIFNQQRLR